MPTQTIRIQYVQMYLKSQGKQLCIYIYMAVIGLAQSRVMAAVTAVDEACAESLIIISSSTISINNNIVYILIPSLMMTKSDWP